jgi:hypothetical protein
MATQMKFITKRNQEGELVKTIYPMGYSINKELHQKKFKECLNEIYKVLHYRKFRLVIHNPNFKLRLKAVRMEIAKYVPSGCSLNGGKIGMEFEVDDFRMAILVARQYGVYNNCYYTIKNKYITRFNPKKDVPYCYDEDFEIRNDKGYDIVEHKDGYFTCYNNGAEDWEYRVLSEDEDAVDEAVMDYLTADNGIYNCDMNWLRNYIKEDILFYETGVAEDDDEDPFDDAERVECPCCMEKYEDLPQGVDTRTIRCGHSFCEPCITNWINQDHNTCPLCRKDIEVDTREERTNQELMNYMNQETAGSILENWFEDKWEMIDAMKDEDGIAHTLGYDDGETIRFSMELDKVMFKVITTDTLEVVWRET